MSDLDMSDHALEALVGEDDDLDSNHAELRQALAKKVSKGTVTLPVPGRDGMEVVYSLDVSIREAQKWERRATPKRGSNGRPDVLILACLTLFYRCKDIRYRGRSMGLTFRDTELREMLGVSEESNQIAVDAIREFYGGEVAEGDVVTALGDWQQAAGLRVDDDYMVMPDQDPTERRS